MYFCPISPDFDSIPSLTFHWFPVSSEDLQKPDRIPITTDPVISKDNKRCQKKSNKKTPDAVIGSKEKEQINSRLQTFFSDNWTTFA